MERDQARAVIENILFIADSSVSTAMFVSLFKSEHTVEEVESIINKLKDDYAGRGLKISEVAGGWRLQTRPEYARWITEFYKMEKGHKLSRASLETLAIIAYRQPVTRTEIDEIRGVDSGGVLRGLVDKTLVKSMGRRKAPGRPLMYGTTNRFLEYFGLARLADLPTLDEFPMDGDGTPRQETMVFPVPDNNEDNQGSEPDDKTIEQTEE